MPWRNFANTMSRKAIIYISFFVVLIIGFYAGLRLVIPGYGDVKLPVLSYVQPFTFTDQNNNTVTQRDVAGKVYLAEYFFTTCKGICPKMNTNMKAVYQQFKDEKDFRILSHTVDPGTDSVARMLHYADSLGVNHSNWLFLTGRKDSLYHAARSSYLLDDPKNGNDRIEDQFIHTQFFALVDRSGRVRKIYDGLKKDELEELKTDVPKLLNEKAESNFVNSLFNK